MRSATAGSHRLGVATLKKEVGPLLRLAVPLAAVHGGSQMMGFVDTAIVGRLGAVPLGAVGLANGLFFTLFVFGIGLVMGLDPMTSQAVGAGDYGRARTLLWQGIWLACGVGLVLSLPIGLAPFLLGPAGVDPSVRHDVFVYILFRLPGVIPGLLLFALRNYLQALKRTKPLVVAVVIGNLVNLPVTMLLCFGGGTMPPPFDAIPPLGVAGAGIATSIGSIIQLPVIMAFLWRDSAPAAVTRKPLGSNLTTALRVGFPVGLHYLVEVAVFALVGILAGLLRPEALAAHQVALTLASFSFTIIMGIGAAASVRVGKAVGREDLPGVRAAGTAAFLSASAVMAAAALAFLLLAHPLVRLLTDQSGVIAVAVPLLAVAAAFQLADGLQGVGAGVLRGAADTRYIFGANMLGHWAIGLPVSAFLAFKAGMGVRGLWWGLFTGLFIVALLLIRRFRCITRRPIARLV